MRNSQVAGLLAVSLAALFAASFVVASGAAPQFDNLVENAILNISEDVPFNFTIAASDAESEYPLVFTHDGAEGNITSFDLVVINGTHALINFTPTNDEVTLNENKFHSVHITIQENSTPLPGSTTRQVFFNVSNTNDAPNVSTYSPSGLTPTLAENASHAFSFDYNNSDVDIQWGDNLIATWYVDWEANTTTNHSGGNWTYSLDYCQPSTINITLNVTDIWGSIDWVYWVATVTNINRNPSFNQSQNISDKVWAEDTSLINNVTLANLFSDPDYDNCALHGDNLSFGHVVVNGSGNITVNISNSTPWNVSFHPDPNFVGIEVIYFTVDDGNGGNAYSNNFTLNVTDENDPPIFDPDPLGDQFAWAEAPFVLDVNATDPDTADVLVYGDNVSVFNISSSSGLISFTPSASDVANYTITINVTDGNYVVNTSFTLRIDPNVAPVLATINSPQNGTEGQAYILNISATDGDNDNLTFTINNSDFTQNTINTTHTQFTWADIPDSAANKTHNLSISVSDIRGSTDTVSVLLYVVDVNFAPNLTALPNFTIRANKTGIYNVTGSDSDGDNLSFTSNDTRINLTILTDTRALINITHGAVEFFAVNISTSDFQFSDWQIVTFNITDNHEPVITDPGLQNATEDIEFNLDLSTFVSDQDTNFFYTEVLTYGINVSWININTSSGDIWFTVNDSAVMNGTFNVTFNVSDDQFTINRSFLINISPSNDPPYFLQSVQNMTEWSNVLEDVQRLIPANADPACSGSGCFINATDEEGHTFNFSVQFLSGPNLALFNWTDGPVSGTAYLNFTPSQSDVGNYTVNLTVIDEFGAWSGELFNFSVQEVNSAPNISTIYPFGTPHSNVTIFEFNMTDTFPNRTTNINFSEGDSVLFNQTTADEEGDSLSYNWTLDGESVSSSSSWTFNANYTHAGLRRIMLTVSDGTNSSNFTWVANISNTELAPVFGLVKWTTESDFSDGSTGNTTINQTGSVTLSSNGLDFSTEGFYLSPILDLRNTNLLQTIPVGVFNLTVVNYTVTVGGAQGTAISLETRTSPDNATWDNWVLLGNVSNTTFDVSSTVRRYFQIRANLSTTNSSFSPTLHELQLEYYIANLTIVEGQQITWIDLDEFFDYDDPDFSPSFVARGYDSGILTVSIDNLTHVVTVQTVPGSLSSDVTTSVQFNMTHGNYHVASNFAPVRLIHDDNSSDVVEEVVQGGGGGGGGGGGSSTDIVEIVKPFEVTEEVLLNVDLLTPESVIIYENETVIAPIKIHNPGNSTLYGILLTTSYNASGIGVSFTQDYFAQLAPDEQQTTNLVITSFRSLGAYEIVVHANVSDPSTSDSAFIMINSIEKGAHNPEEINTRIAFTRDLLASNPQCLELTEMLTRAQSALEAGELAQAEEMLSVVLENCRFLVTTAESNDPVTGIRRLYTQIFGNVPTTRALRYAAVTTVAFLILFSVVLYERVKIWRLAKLRRQRFKKKPKKPRMESA